MFTPEIRRGDTCVKDCQSETDRDRFEESECQTDKRSKNLQHLQEPGPEDVR